jgi:hypothetical protein
MPHTVDPRHLVSTLTGTWRIGASNIPVWLTGQRSAPTVSYEPVDGRPLHLNHCVSFTVSDGRRERRSSVAAWHRDGFVSRGKRLQKVFPSKWSVSGASEDEAICVTRFLRTRTMPAGITVLVRAGHLLPDLRGVVGREHEKLGLSPEEFARLTWFDLSSATLR